MIGFARVVYPKPTFLQTRLARKPYNRGHWVGALRATLSSLRSECQIADLIFSI